MTLQRKRFKENNFPVWFQDDEMVEIIIYNLICAIDSGNVKRTTVLLHVEKSDVLRPVAKRHTQKSSPGELGTLKATLYGIPFLTWKCRREWVVHVSTRYPTKGTDLFIEKLAWEGIVSG